MEETKENIQEDIKEFKTDFNEGELKEAESELMLGYKKLVYPKLGIIYVRFPTLKEDAEIGQSYSDAYFKLLKNTDLPSMKQLLELLDKKGLWTEEDDKKLTELQNLFTSKTITLEEIKNKKRKSDEDKENINKCIEERNHYYNLFVEKLISKNTMIDNCLEKKAEQETIYIKLVKCTYRENNKPVWDSVETLLNSSSELEFENLLVDCINYWRGVFVPLSGI